MSKPECTHEMFCSVSGHDIDCPMNMQHVSRVTQRATPTPRSAMAPEEGDPIFQVDWQRRGWELGTKLDQMEAALTKEEIAYTEARGFEPAAEMVLGVLRRLRAILPPPPVLTRLREVEEHASSPVWGMYVEWRNRAEQAEREVERLKGDLGRYMMANNRQAEEVARLWEALRQIGSGADNHWCREVAREALLPRRAVNKQSCEASEPQ